MALPPFMLDMMPDEITAIPGGEKAFGGFEATTPVLTLQCLISRKGGNNLIRNTKGEEVVSSVRVLVGSVNGLSVKGFRYRLPDDGRFDPHGNSPQDPIEAIRVDHASDGKEPSHEIVYLP